ncbi:MAG: tRNA (adenosine(37)-N6)-dimethylallyltransferase MiaA [Muribaculaceae bacterium]|nr:tRNA (adenosine(37)-N6)-dimethylallyltransferase MiaA [Muribaculaceae bacterium]
MKTLIVITGPTASGKTSVAVELAKKLGCDVISADSRQIFRQIPIGTATPGADEMQGVTHHFIACRDLDQYYSAATFEADVLALLPKLWETNDYAIMCGGSMMYVDAVVNGIDDLPDISPAIRQHAASIYRDGGIEAIRAQLQILDPDYYEQVDINNHKRLVHAVEICLQAGKPYSSLRTGQRKTRDFHILKFAIDIDRSELFDRINRRVDMMIEQGLEEEARHVYPLRHLNSLNTVGYKEMFALFDGIMDRPTAIARLQKNTRVYAKKQITWLKRDASVIYVARHGAADKIMEYLSSGF